MARKRGGLRTSVYQGADHWSILFRNGQYCVWHVFLHYRALEMQHTLVADVDALLTT
jgi:hypothetical protein